MLNPLSAEREESIIGGARFTILVLQHYLLVRPVLDENVPLWHMTLFVKVISHFNYYAIKRLKGI